MSNKEYGDTFMRKANWLKRLIHHFSAELLPEYKTELETEVATLKKIASLWHNR